MPMPPSTQSIRELVSTQFSAAAVLERFEIDICSRADESLNDACAELQLSVDQVLDKLSDAASREHGEVPDLASYSSTRLIQHIVRAHHQNVRRELPRLGEMAHKLAGKHGHRFTELENIAILLEKLHAEMLAHLQKEEQVLFPFIVQMEEGTGGGSLGGACFRTVAQPISMMVQEHESAEGTVAEIRNLTCGFNTPDQACPTHIALFSGLRGFESDLREHVHLENDLLFPRAIELEISLKQQR